MPKFRVRLGDMVTLERWGYVDVDADTPAEALAFARDNADELLRNDVIEGWAVNQIESTPWEITIL